MRSWYPLSATSRSRLPHKCKLFWSQWLILVVLDWPVVVVQYRLLSKGAVAAVVVDVVFRHMMHVWLWH